MLFEHSTCGLESHALEVTVAKEPRPTVEHAKRQRSA